MHDISCRGGSTKIWFKVSLANFTRRIERCSSRHNGVMAPSFSYTIICLLIVLCHFKTIKFTACHAVAPTLLRAQRKKKKKDNAYQLGLLTQIINFTWQLKYFPFSQLSREPETLQVHSDAHIMYNCTPPNSSRKSTKHV